MAEENKTEEKKEEPKEAPKEEKPEQPKEEKGEEKTEESKEAPKEEKPKEEPKKPSVNYVYGALLLHSAGKEINEVNLKKVIDATGTSPDPAQVKALVSSLEGVDIDDAIKQSFMSAAPTQTQAPAEEKKEEKKEEAPEKKAEEAAEGLSSLFG